jgi:hypothetical protein
MLMVVDLVIDKVIYIHTYICCICMNRFIHINKYFYPDTGVDPDKVEPDEEDRGLNMLSPFMFSIILSSSEFAASALDIILLFYI